MASTLLQQEEKKSGLAYRQFSSVADYKEFYDDLGPHTMGGGGNNKAMMWVPNPDDGLNHLVKVGLWDPEEDKDLTRILASPEFKKVKYYVAPVMKTWERVAKTARNNYRFERSDEVITRYRDEMRRGDPFPLLGFDLRRDFWPSGEHRLLAGNDYQAHFSVVWTDLTDEQLVMIYEKTNLHHSNGYTNDERANLFYDLKNLPGVTELDAYRRAGLVRRQTNGQDKSETTIRGSAKAYALAGELIRLYPSVRDTGGGRTRPMNTIGMVATALGGAAAIKELTEDEWLQAFALGAGLYNGSSSISRTTGGRPKKLAEMKPRERLARYVQVREDYNRKQALRKSGVTNASVDDRALVDIAEHIVAYKKVGLSTLRATMSEDERELVARATYLLNLVFGGADGE